MICTVWPQEIVWRNGKDMFTILLDLDRSITSNVNCVNTNALTATTTMDIVTALTALVREQYVFPEQADRISVLLTAQYEAGKYASMAQASELALAITNDLQSVNGDKHLRLKYTDHELSDLSDPVAEVERWSTAADRDAAGIARVELLSSNIGLVEIRPVLYPAVFSGDRIAAAMTIVSGCDALVLDVRGCVGGSPDSVALLCSYLFDDEPVHLNSMRFRDEVRVEQSWTQAWVPGKRFGRSKPLVLLTSSQTFSGGEELAYDLQQLGRARVVGEQTGGGANPREGYRLHPHLEATIPVAYPVNPMSGTNWELTGVTPDIPTTRDDALMRAIETIGL
jgi:hypothetical protein